MLDTPIIKASAACNHFLNVIAGYSIAPSIMLPTLVSLIIGGSLIIVFELDISKKYKRTG